MRKKHAKKTGGKRDREGRTTRQYLIRVVGFGVQGLGFRV